MKVAALIVAGGQGTRAGGETPKQYRPLLGAPLLRHTVQAFAGHPAVAVVQSVIGAGSEDFYQDAAEGLDLLPPVLGGATRGASVLNGLKALAAHAPDAVLIHDGARPCVSQAVISRVIDEVARGGGAIAALPVSDTLKTEQSGTAKAGPPRERLWRAQTPQGFPFAAILAAHNAATGTETDDAAVAEAAGITVALIRGSEDNIKVTYEDDFARAEAILEQQKGRGRMETRTGLGVDVHRFGPGDHVMLCGVAIPHSAALAGHSDADVALHAATDAVLGAIGEGDIGTHFPPSDEQWRGASSDRFLAHAAEMLRNINGRLTHLDITIICEAPKVGPHREAMRTRVAEICGVDEGRISVKATTTEKLGFTGRGEGIEAKAVATVELPRSDT